MEMLVGYRDPNFIPIKDFYEYNFNVNYLSLFIKDEKPIVREEFMDVIENWMENLPDREDHFPRLIPYLMSFLFDIFIPYLMRSSRISHLLSSSLNSPGS